MLRLIATILILSFRWMTAVIRVDAPNQSLHTEFRVDICGRPGEFTEGSRMIIMRQKKWKVWIEHLFLISLFLNLLRQTMVGCLSICFNQNKQPYKVFSIKDQNISSVAQIDETEKLWMNIFFVSRWHFNVS